MLSKCLLRAELTTYVTADNSLDYIIYIDY